MNLVRENINHFLKNHGLETHFLSIYSYIKNSPAKRFTIGTVNNQFDFAICAFAILFSKKTLVLIPNYLPGTLESLSSTFDEFIDQNRITQLISQESAKAEPPTELSENNEIHFFTSGTTGEYKVSIKSLKNILSEVITLNSTFNGLPKSTQFVSTVPPHHLYGFLFSIMWPLIGNYEVQRSVVKYPEELLKETKNFVLITSPAFIKRIYFTEPVNFKNCAGIFSSGGPLEFKHAQSAKDLFTHIPVEVYGSTETGGIGHRQQITENPSWTLFPNVELSQNEEATSIRSPFFKESTLFLDDRITLDNDNSFKLLGRKDRIVKVEEKRVSLNAVELHLEKIPFIQNAKCFSLDRKNRTIVAAAIVLNNEGQTLFDKLGKKGIVSSVQEKLTLHFERIVLPKTYQFVDSIETNEMGKVDLKRLKEAFHV